MSEIKSIHGYKLCDEEARSSLTELEKVQKAAEERISTLEDEVEQLKAKLNSISFGVDENGNLTYEKEVSNDENDS